MYEVWDGDRIVYISISFRKAYQFFEDHLGKWYDIRYCAMQN